MLNKKGFTLIEILAVIIILSLIMVVVTSRSFNIVDTAKTKLFEIKAKRLLEAAKTKYYSDCVIGLNSSNCAKTIWTMEDITGATDDNYDAKFKISYEDDKINVNGIITDKKNNKDVAINNSNLGNVQEIRYAYLIRRTSNRSIATDTNTNTNYASTITKINFVKGIPNNLDNYTHWLVNDTSKSGENIYAWLDGTILNIGSIGYIYAPENSSSLFSGFSNLTEIDFSNFNTSNVTNMDTIFYNSKKLERLDLSNFNTSKVNNMANMFNNCKNLTYLDLSSFNTENVEYLNGMFIRCYKLKEIDLSNFNTQKVTDMSSMFYMERASGDPEPDLNTIYVSNSFITTNVENSKNMFLYSSQNLEGGNGTKWDKNNPTDKTYARIDGGESNPGYFTLKQ